ncbi:MAG: TSUP family transporter, partial [Ilumatobacteraceae bacterium]
MPGGLMLAVDFSAIDYVLAALAAFAAGIVNALAGGGTLISFPALMALGATNVGANITNTVALCPGYLGGAYAQRSSLADDRSLLRVLSAAACLGGLTG